MSDSAYRRWAAGLCPCCGSDLDPWPGDSGVTDPLAIGEGVVMCGRCIAMKHHQDGLGTADELLRSIATRTDED